MRRRGSPAGSFSFVAFKTAEGKIEKPPQSQKSHTFEGKTPKLEEQFRGYKSDSQ
jgi:hypothetical protein